MKLSTVLKIVIAGALAAGGYFAVREFAKPEVTVTPARRGAAVATVTGSVTVIPAYEARVMAPERGVLLKFGLREGDRVKKGDVIAEI